MRGSGPAPPDGRPGRRNPALMTPFSPNTCTFPAPAASRRSGRDTPLGPGGADRQEDGKADLLRQRQLGPALGGGQPRLHQPRRVRERHPVPRYLPEGYRRWAGVRSARPQLPPLRACPGPGPLLLRAWRLRGGLPSRHPRPAVRTARVHVGALPARGRSVPPRIPGRRDPGSRPPLPPLARCPAVLRHPPGRRRPPVSRGTPASRTGCAGRTTDQGAAPRHGRRSPRPWRHGRAVHPSAPPVPDGATASAASNVIIRWPEQPPSLSSVTAVQGLKFRIWHLERLRPEG